MHSKMQTFHVRFYTNGYFSGHYRGTAPDDMTSVFTTSVLMFSNVPSVYQLLLDSDATSCARRVELDVGWVFPSSTPCALTSLRDENGAPTVTVTSERVAFARTAVDARIPTDRVYKLTPKPLDSLLQPIA